MGFHLHYANVNSIGNISKITFNNICFTFQVDYLRGEVVLDLHSSLYNLLKLAILENCTCFISKALIMG